MRRLMLWIGGLLALAVILTVIFYTAMLAAAVALIGLAILVVMEIYARFRIWRSREQ